jgi:hypothetical protein
MAKVAVATFAGILLSKGGSSASFDPTCVPFLLRVSEYGGRPHAVFPESEELKGSAPSDALAAACAGAGMKTSERRNSKVAVKAGMVIVSRFIRTLLV